MSSQLEQVAQLNPDDLRDARIAELWRSRPRSLLLRVSLIGLTAMAAGAWLSGEIQVAELFSARRFENVKRFIAQDVMPYPLRSEGFSLTGLWDWAQGLLAERGWRAMSATLWISVLAMCIAGTLGGLLAPLGARTLMTADPYLEGGSGGTTEHARKRATHASLRNWPWHLISSGARASCVAARAIPEYIWAFLLLSLLGANAWPAVIALAIHNAGILGRLGSDTIENLDRAPLRSLRALGATRRQLWSSALLPLGLGRYLLYFFYRFETCVREATVLGMLGIVSLGYWINEARAAGFYDEIMLYVALGSVLVLCADLCSHVVRGLIRRAA